MLFDILDYRLLFQIHLKKRTILIKYSCLFEKNTLSLIDFVTTMSDEKVYFQVSWQIASNRETAQREYAPLLALNDHYRKILVTLDDYRFPSNNGIEHLFPWEINSIK